MGRHVAEPETETRTDTLDRLAANVHAALQEWLVAYRGDPSAMVVEWAAAIEWSNPEVERERKSGILVACQDDRVSSATVRGLGLVMAGMAR